MNIKNKIVSMSKKSLLLVDMTIGLHMGFYSKPLFPTLILH